MRKVAMALLIGAYITLSLTLALIVWRAGGWAPGLSAGIGGLALLFGIHGLIARGVERERLSLEISAVREAHVILADQIEQFEARIGALSTEVHEEAEELSGEVRMLEDLVQRMTRNMELRAPVAPGPAEYRPRAPQQRNALLDTIRDALSENRVDLYLQPVVALPQRRTQFYEGYSRLRDETGRVMMPAEYLAVAEPEGLISAIDNLLLFRCMQIVRRLAAQDREVGIFCNISLASLGDEEFFPQFLEFLVQNKDLHGALIFELGQEAFSQRGSVETRNMAKLADLGFHFSLDKVTDLSVDLRDLQRSDVKYLKVSAQTLRQELQEVDGRLTFKSLRDLDAADFADLARRHGVEIVAEKIETEPEAIEVIELNIGFGQGHLFGQPRAIKEQILAETEPPAGFVDHSLKRAAGDW
jgi:cyclic-di-GMP phosphodiesterase TipF (flagellum assembly factor)